MSYPEKMAYEWLEKRNIEFKHQQKVGAYYADFIVNNTNIEIDGIRWHPPGNEKDLKRDEFFKSLGFKVERILSNSSIENSLEILFNEM